MTSLSIAGKLLFGNEFLPGAITINGDRIAEICRSPSDGPPPQLEAAYIAPGLIDLQVNGGFGVEIGEDPAAIQRLAEKLPAAGVTAFLPTIITSPAAEYARAFDAFASARNGPGARALGFHLEGPFLSPQRAGAHRIELIEAADQELLETLLAYDGIRLMTLAPERPGALDRIRRFRERGIVISLGHTDATFDEFVAGLDAGATMATHLYNAMSPFGHRAPQAAGAALVDDRATVGLIADGVHSHPASIQLAFRAKGPDRIVLVSDLMPAAGMPPGRFQFGGQIVTVDGTAATLEDGTLAGSVVTLDQAIRNIVKWTDATPAEAIRMASDVPARLLGLNDLGKIEEGCTADLVLFDEAFNVTATIVGGQIAYRRGRALTI
jgi:N-acetylglucosamine-6-phosphate deacetylase